MQRCAALRCGECKVRHYAKLKAAHEAERRRVKTPKELEELEYRRKEKEAQHILGQQMIDKGQRESLLAQNKNPAPSAESRREAEAVRKKQALAVENEQSRLAHELRDRVLGIASDRRRSEQQQQRQEIRARMTALDKTPLQSLSSVSEVTAGGVR